MRAHVGELHEVAEVLDRPVAPAVVEVANERRAVVRGEDRGHAANLDAVRRVARVLGELARRGGLHDLPAHPARKPDALALDVRAGVLEQADRHGIAAELEAHFLEDRVGVVLERREPLFVEDLERLELPGEERHPLDLAAETRGLTTGPTAAAVARGLVDRHDSSFAAAGTGPVVALRRRPGRAASADAGLARAGSFTARSRFG